MDVISLVREVYWIWDSAIWKDKLTPWRQSWRIQKEKAIPELIDLVEKAMYKRLWKMNIWLILYSNKFHEEWINPFHKWIFHYWLIEEVKDSLKIFPKLVFSSFICKLSIRILFLIYLSKSWQTCLDLWVRNKNLYKM